MHLGSSLRGSSVTNPTSTHEDLGSILGLAQYVWASSITVGCGMGRTHGSAPLLLWLLCGLAAAAPIQSLAWELLYATVDATLKKTKQKKKQKKCT